MRLSPGWSPTAKYAYNPRPHATPEQQHTEERKSMAKTTDIRPVITLRSTAGTGSTYTTTKNRRNTPNRLELLKFDPVLRKRVIFQEVR
jgi:large subunit ribosomal protein L33